ncbi:MAG: hypothetical protein ABJB03_02600 [Rhodoglobus sp.]
MADALPPPFLPPPAKKSFLFLWIGLGMVLVLGAGIVGLFFLIPVLIGSAGSTPDAGPVTPDAPVVVADQPCTGKCFTIAEARTLTPTTEALDVVGLTENVKAEAEDTTAGRAVDDTLATWQGGKGSPEGCAMMISYSPVGPGSPTNTAPALAEPVIDLGVFGTDAQSISQTVRVFHTEALAAGFPGIIYSEIRDCGHYSVDFGGSEVYRAQVVQRELVGAPDVVGYVGWDEPSSEGTFTSVDLQYGNLVVRTTLNRGLVTEISNEMFDEYLRETAQAMVALDH